eukprot:992107_1
MNSRILIKVIVFSVCVFVAASLTNENLKSRYDLNCEIILGVYEQKENQQLWPAIPVVFNHMKFHFDTSPDIGVKTFKAYIRQKLGLKTIPLKHLKLWFEDSKVQLMDNNCLEDYREHIAKGETAYFSIYNGKLAEGQHPHAINGNTYDVRRLYCMDFLKQFGDQYGELLKRAVRIGMRRIWLYEILFVRIPRSYENREYRYQKDLLAYLKDFQSQLAAESVRQTLVSLRYKSYKVDQLPCNLNPSFRMYGPENDHKKPRERGYNPLLDRNGLWKFPRKIDISLCSIDGVDQVYIVVLLENKLRSIVGRALLRFDCKTLTLFKDTLMWNTCHKLGVAEVPGRVKPTFVAPGSNNVIISIHEFDSSVFLDKLGFSKEIEDAKHRLYNKLHRNDLLVAVKDDDIYRSTIMPLLLGLLFVFLAFGISMTCVIVHLSGKNNGMSDKVGISNTKNTHDPTSKRTSSCNTIVPVVGLLTLLIGGLMAIALCHS